MRVNQVWSADITYVRLERGFVYLVAIIDWFSRYVLAWEVSTTLDSSFCISALEWALASGAQPEIFNSGQGSQFTSAEFTKRLIDRSIQISMDGRGRALDNVFVERLWRSVKYEEIFLNDYPDVETAVRLPVLVENVPPLRHRQAKRFCWNCFPTGQPTRPTRETAPSARARSVSESNWR